MGNPNEVEYSTESGAAPPPYTATAANASSASAPSYQTIAGASIAGVHNRFPQSLNAYYEKKMFSKNMTLGEEQDKPLFTVTMHSGLTKKPLLELHAGPSDATPIIATAAHESKWSSGRTTIIQITPDGATSAVGPSSGSSGSGSGSTSGLPQEGTTVTMVQPHSWRHVTYKFSVKVGLGKDVREEEFEWRGSRGGEVQGLDKWSRGWKLVRLNSTALGEGGERKMRSAGATSDGKEVVAVYSQSTEWSIYKVFKFQFIESGVTGVLGDTFAIAAVMSATKIWYNEFIQQTTAAAAAS